MRERGLQGGFCRMLRVAAAALVAYFSAWPDTAQAIEIQGIQPISFDLPRVYGVFLQPGDTPPYAPYLGEDFFGNKVFSVRGFLDTGSSGIVIDPRTRELFGLPTTPGVRFRDVAVGGTTDFDVSQNFDLRISHSTELDLNRISTINTSYPNAYSSLRMQVGPVNTRPDPDSPTLDIYGMPVMLGKHVVINPRPLNDLSDLVHTFVYDPGKPYNPHNIEFDPGIPATSHQIKLSYGDFHRFTETTPAGADPPSFAHNPFIGPNPINQLLDNPPVDNTPPVRIGYNGLQTSGSFLLDTGAVTSFISTKLAAELGISYSLNPADPDVPELVFADGQQVPGQFIFPIQGIGGAATLAGFFLDHLTLETIQGGPGDNPQNLRYARAPVMVIDIDVLDPLTGDRLTLDGVFGMNYLLASAFLTPDLNIGETAISPYHWITFDEPNGILGLDYLHQVPEPGTAVLAALGVAVLAAHAWRRRGCSRGA